MLNGDQYFIALSVQSCSNFPEAKHWLDASFVVGGSVAFNEKVIREGPAIMWSKFIDDNPNDEYGLVILPDINDIDFNARPDMSWFKVQIPWGYLDPDSYADWVNYILNPLNKIFDSIPDNVGDFPPTGPAYRAGWNGVGSAGGKYERY